MRRPNGYWTPETIAQSAAHYSTVRDWSLAEMGAYQAARRKGILAEVTCHMMTHGESISRARTLWTRAACLESARRFSQRSAWEKGDNPAYQAAKKHGWYEDCVEHMPMSKQRNGYWTPEACLNEARRHQTISAWLSASASSYQKAKRSPDLFRRCTAHMTRLWEEKWTPQAITLDAQKYATLREWAQQSPGAYSACLRLGLIKATTAHMEKNPRWFGVANIQRILLSHSIKFETEKTFDDCRDKRKLPFDFFLPDFNLLIEHHGTQHRRGWQGSGVDAIKRRDAIKREYATRTGITLIEIAEWEHESPESVETTILDALARFDAGKTLAKRTLSAAEVRKTTVRHAFDLPSLREIASQFSTRAEFKRNNEPAYNFACRHDLINQVCNHMLSKAQAQTIALTKWTKEKVIASARKFRTSREWAKGEGAAYNAARKHGWIGEASAHFPTRTRTRRIPSPYVG